MPLAPSFPPALLLTSYMEARSMLPTLVSPSIWQVRMRMTRDYTSLTTGVVGFSGMILWWVRILNEFEVAGERLHRMARLTQTLICHV